MLGGSFDPPHKGHLYISLEAKKILKEIIFSNNNTYSVLSFFLLMNENLIKDQQEVDDLFNHLLKDGNFDKEVENLIELYLLASTENNKGIVDECEKNSNLLSQCLQYR